MSNLKTITIENIQIEIYKILLINANHQVNQFQLYGKVIDNLGFDSKFVDNRFKSVFILAIQQLPSTYDDISVSCVYVNNSKVYNVLYESDDTDDEYTTPVDIDENIDLLTDNEKNEYRIKNNENINYIDPITGSSIVHELIIAENSLLLNELINRQKIDLLYKDGEQKTPLNYIKYNDQKMINLLLEHAFLQISKLEDNNNKLENRIKKLEKENNTLTLYDLIVRKVAKTIINNLLIILGSFIVFYILFKLFIF